MVTRIGPKTPVRLYISEWRFHRDDMSQEQLANRIGSTKSSISRWETGERDITAGALAAIAEALQCEVPDLYRHPDRPSPEALMQAMQGLDDTTRKQAFRLIEALKTGT
jgi:transcriptional regulator with XRE-family HTH domain